MKTCGVLENTSFLLDPTDSSFLHCSAFRQQDITIKIYKSLEDLKFALKNKSIDYYVLAVKCKKNYVSKLFSKQLSVDDASAIIEIGAFTSRIVVKQFQKNESLKEYAMAYEHDFLRPINFFDKYLKSCKNEDYASIFKSNDTVIIPFNINKSFDAQIVELKINKEDFSISDIYETEIEYRVFELNHYHANVFVKASLFLGFLLRYMVSTVGSIIVSILLIVTAFLINGILLKNNEQLGNTITLATSMIAIILQMFAQSKVLENLLNRQVLKGKWIYYSVPIDESMNKAIPFGFITRLFEIDWKDNKIFFRGKIVNSSTYLFESNGCEVDIDNRLKNINGFYEFTYSDEAAINNHIEGLVRFYGRRKSIIKPFNILTGWFTGRKTKVIGNLLYIRIAKEQYDLLSQCSTYLTDVEQSNIASRRLTIAVFGSPLSQTHLAAMKKFGIYDNFVFYTESTKLVQSLENGESQIGVLPILNNDIGEISENVALIQNEQLIEIGKFENDIIFCLAGVKGAKINDIKRVTSNIQSLNQCLGFIQENNLEIVDKYVLNKRFGGSTLHITDSASAAYYLSKQPDQSIGVICTKEAAKEYHLEVLVENVSKKGNVTTFGIYMKSK